MTDPILAVRIARRGVGAAVLSAGSIMFVDGRHVTAGRTRAVKSAVQYLLRLVGMIRPGVIVIDASRQAGSTTDAMVSRFLETRGHIPVCIVPVTALLTAYALPSLTSRKELRGIAAAFCPSQPSRSLAPYLLDASAVALFAESAFALGDLTV